MPPRYSRPRTSGMSSPCTTFMGLPPNSFDRRLAYRAHPGSGPRGANVSLARRVSGWRWANQPPESHRPRHLRLLSGAMDAQRLAAHDNGQLASTVELFGG